MSGATAAGARSRWAHRLAAPAALVVLTLAVYGNTLQNGFVWDDEVIVVSNPNTSDLASMGRVLLSPDETPPYYRPLNRASYLVDHALFGMDPRGFHAVNVLVHAASVVALYAFALRFLRRRSAAFLAAALLAIHPVHSEPVNFVTARNNLFALLFALLAVVFAMDALDRRSRWRAAASGFALFLALASKEQGAMALPFIVAWLFAPKLFGRDPSTEPARRTRLSLLAPHAVAVSVYAVLRVYSLGGLGGGGPPPSEGLLSRLALNWFAVPRYLALLAFPRDLTVFHVIQPGHPLDPWWLALCWAALLAVIVAVMRRPSPGSVAGLVWLALNIAPIANLVPIPSTAFAERFFHAAAVGVWLLAADGVARLATRLPPRVLWAACAAMGLALATRTFARNRDWRDDVSLAASAVEVNPSSVRARFNLGNALKDRGDVAGARAQWEAALAIDPVDAQTLAQLGTLHAMTGDLTTAEDLLRRAITSDASVAIAHLNLARILDRTGRRASALESYEAFLETATPLDAALVPRARARAEELRRASQR